MYIHSRWFPGSKWFVSFKEHWPESKYMFDMLKLNKVEHAHVQQVHV